MGFIHRPWFIGLCAVVAAIQIWAFADNVVDRDWFPAVCFGVTSLVFTVNTVVLLRLRRRALR